MPVPEVARPRAVASNRSCHGCRAQAAQPQLMMAGQQPVPRERRRAGAWQPEAAVRRQPAEVAAAAAGAKRARLRFQPAAAALGAARAKPRAARPSAISASSASAVRHLALQRAEAHSLLVPLAAAGRCGRRACEPHLMAPGSPPRLDKAPEDPAAEVRQDRCRCRERPSPPRHHQAARCRRPAATRRRARPRKAPAMAEALSDRYSTADLPAPEAVRPPTATSALRRLPPEHQANLCVSFDTAPMPAGE